MHLSCRQFNFCCCHYLYEWVNIEPWIIQRWPPDKTLLCNSERYEIKWLHRKYIYQSRSSLLHPHEAPGPGGDDKHYPTTRLCALDYRSRLSTLTQLPVLSERQRSPGGLLNPAASCVFSLCHKWRVSCQCWLFAPLSCVGITQRWHLGVLTSALDFHATWAADEAEETCDVLCTYQVGSLFPPGTSRACSYSLICMVQEVLVSRHCTGSSSKAY